MYLFFLFNILYIRYVCYRHPSLTLSEMEGVQEISPALGHDESGRLAAHYTMKHQPLEAGW